MFILEKGPEQKQTQPSKDSLKTENQLGQAKAAQTVQSPARIFREKMTPEAVQVHKGSGKGVRFSRKEGNWARREGEGHSYQSKQRTRTGQEQALPRSGRCFRQNP